MIHAEHAYIRMRNKVKIKAHGVIRLGEIAQIASSSKVEELLKKTVIYTMTEADGNLIAIDAIRILQIIKELYPELEIILLGNEETLIEVENKKGTRVSSVGHIFVWILLFFGSGLAIMNFHTDVSMAEVHQRIFYLLTGEHKKHPFLLQVPYSIGIGVGMIIFFNHIFQKRINEEPSPLELEMFLYQENLEKYAKVYQNQENNREKYGR